jgi:hypothetical protein
VGDVSHLLLVPAEAHREALLGDGPCGARVPVAHRWEFDSPKCKTPWEAGWPKSGGATVLALAWRGRSTGPEGLARALAVLAEQEGLDARGGSLWRKVTPGEWALTTAARSLKGSERRFVAGPVEDSIPGAWWCVPALATPPDGLGDLLDLWALGTVAEARGLGKLEVVRG